MKTVIIHLQKIEMTSRLSICIAVLILLNFSFDCAEETKADKQQTENAPLDFIPGKLSSYN